MPEIVQWADLQEEFSEGLLLGNGASVAVHNGFHYASLFDAARVHGHLTEEVTAVFTAFDEDDFELVLRRLWQAKLVNQALAIPAGQVEAAYNQVRTALIATVRDVHVTYDNALPHLRPIFEFMSRFKTVVSLNYDLIVYWAAMYSRNWKPNWFKDCFNAGTFVEDWKRFRTPWGQAAGSTLCFYPHGNLALTRTRGEIESKITAGGAALLDSILNEWANGDVVPLFVCEGTSLHKKDSIHSSSYLQRVYREVVPDLGASLVIYGWGIGQQELHLLEQIRRARCQRVAVSVCGDDQAYAQRVEEQLHAIGIADVRFFDSLSPGCWNNVA
jgi:hypothetical protein